MIDCVNDYSNHLADTASWYRRYAMIVIPRTLSLLFSWEIRIIGFWHNWWQCRLLCWFKTFALQPRNLSVHSLLRLLAMRLAASNFATLRPCRVVLPPERLAALRSAKYLTITFYCLLLGCWLGSSTKNNLAPFDSLEVQRFFCSLQRNGFR